MEKRNILKTLIITTYILLFLLTIIFLSLFITSYLSINNLFINEIDNGLVNVSSLEQFNDTVYLNALRSTFNTTNIELINIYKNIQISSMFFLSLYLLTVVSYFSLWCYFWITKNSLFLDTHKELITSAKKKLKDLSKKNKKKMKKFLKILKKIK